MPTIPHRMTRLDLDPIRGVPVPWFVAWIDGSPDFRVIGPGKIVEALNGQLCWVCGQRRGRYATFLIGPMCAVNRVSAEPPSHRDCAIYSAQACPFLTNPDRRRRETRMPEGTEQPAGVSIRRNPGVSLVWTSERFTTWRPPGGGILLDIGDPVETLWFAHGRPATRQEVQASIDSGLPELRAMAELEGDAAVGHLERLTVAALRLIPA